MIIGKENAETATRLQVARQAMVERQIAYPHDSRPSVRDSAVLAAMREVPRHLFVPPVSRAAAYDDHPLSLGHGQTISQPYIVAFMTELLAPRAEHRVLEVGTGSGYQAAVLSRIVKEVYTIEIVEALARGAQETLRELGYDNVQLRAGDGYAGWPEAAPFDSIIVTAAPDHIPRPLVEQLKNGGRMVIPVGQAGWIQQLQLLEKDEQGRVQISDVMPVGFVPLTRGVTRDS
jgi:protein-L-isoaspartate(D-aspartate) O-methyltransferase